MNAAAMAIARTLAAQFANEAPWTDRGESDSDDAIGQVSAALDPDFSEKQAVLLEEIRDAVGADLYRRVCDFLGDVSAHSEDGGYLFGLAVGQLIRIPALAPTDEHR